MKLVSHQRLTRGSSDDYETPPELFKKINKVFKFDLDVAAQKETAKCKKWLGPGSKLAEDALNPRPWSLFGKVCWCNPPYLLWAEFAAKAAESAAWGVTTVMIVPPRTETEAFHDYISQSSEIVFLQRRVSFLLNGVVQTRNGAGSMLAVFREQRRGRRPVLEFWDWKNEPYPV